MLEAQQRRFPMHLLIILLISGFTYGANDRLRRQAITFGGPAKTTPVTPDCRDWDGRPGQCRLVANCPHIRRILSAPLNPSIISNLRRSVCGVFNTGTRRIPKLCCAISTSGDLQSTQPSSSTSATSPVTPSSTSRPTSRPTTRRTTTKSSTTQPTTNTPVSTTASPEVNNSSNGDINSHPSKHLLPSNCGVNVNDRIIGGEEALLGSYPWLAVLGYQVSGSQRLEFKCGGTLINKNYVITAAHCVRDLPSQFRLSAVRLGEHNLDSDVDCQTVGGRQTCAVPFQQFRPAEVKTHPRYNQPHRFQNDIAIIRLDKPANFNAFVSAICLPFGNEPNFSPDLSDQTLTVAGFGLTEAFGESSKVLMHVQVPLFDHDRCRSIFARLGGQIGDNQLCAGGVLGKDSCSGDSGGPLMAFGRFGPPYRLVGIVSYGVQRCGSAGRPGVYTRVASFLPWILDNIHA